MKNIYIVVYRNPYNWNVIHIDNKAFTKHEEAEDFLINDGFIADSHELRNNKPYVFYKDKSNILAEIKRLDVE